MIKLYLHNYSEKQVNILLELLQSNYEALLDEHCLLTIPVEPAPDNLSDLQTIFCDTCPVKWLCQDLDNDIEYLLDLTNELVMNRKTKIKQARKKHLQFPD